MASHSSYNRFSFKNVWPLALLIGAGSLVLYFFVIHPNSEQDAVSLTEIFPGDEEVSETFVSESEEVPAVAKILSDTPVKSEPVSNAPAAANQNLPLSESFSDNAKPLTIQVLSFKDQSYAQKAVENLRKSGFEAYIVSKDLKEKGIWFRVCVGNFNHQAEAEGELSRLKKDYKDSFVVTK